MLDTALSLLMIASLALLGGAFLLWRKGERKRAGLMALLAVVMVVNLVIWTAPTTGGATLAGAAHP
jgi:drug/metabolite transporter superfamily protein YnfA